jgi:hypothetical protein
MFIVIACKDTLLGFIKSEFNFDIGDVEHLVDSHFRATGVGFSLEDVEVYEVKGKPYTIEENVSYTINQAD